MPKQWRAYCYACLGGGKDLTGPTTKKKANAEAGSRMTWLHHDVGVLEVKQVIVWFTFQRTPEGGKMYLIDGVGYASLIDARRAHPGAVLKRVKATPQNRLFG
jgi:hypothetical protein